MKKENIRDIVRLVSSVCLIVLIAFSLQSCGPTANNELDQNLKKAVVMKYVHLANVGSFQNQSSQFQGVNNGSFWALFDICTLDIQGSSLTGFNYDSAKFFIDAGTATYGSTTPGNVNSTLGVKSSQDLQVLNAVSQTFSLNPATQFFPKQFYPGLKYRIAIFVKENPAGYQGDAMTLKYNGQPEVAALVQGVSPGNPAFIPFYNPGATPQIVSTCP